MSYYKSQKFKRYEFHNFLWKQIHRKSLQNIKETNHLSKKMLLSQTAPANYLCRVFIKFGRLYLIPTQNLRPKIWKLKVKLLNDTNLRTNLSSFHDLFPSLPPSTGVAIAGMTQHAWQSRVTAWQPERSAQLSCSGPLFIG